MRSKAIIRIKLSGLEAQNMKNFLLVMVLLMFLSVSGCSSNFSNYEENSGNDSWDATYEKFDGHRQREITISDESEFTFTVEIVTNSGTLGLSIKSEDGVLLYSGKDIPSSSFEVKADSGGKYIIRFDADNHNGSFDIKW